MSNPKAEVEVPSLPRGKLDKIIVLATRLEYNFSHFLNAVISDGLARTLANSAHAEISESSKTIPPFVNVLNTFSQYVGHSLDKRLARTMAWQIAARQNELYDNLLIAYTKPIKHEWVGLEIANVQPSIWRGDKRGVMVTFFVLSGHPAGHTLTRNFPESWLTGFAYKIGFSRRVPYDSNEPRHFLGLRIWAFLQPEEGSEEISFDRWEISPAFRKNNVSIIKLRTRFEQDHKDNSSESGVVECPYKLEHDCWDCPKGKQACPASCLPRS